MTETIKQAKLIQYLSEAYAKEKELETALEAHIPMTTRKPYEKRLRAHLKETKSHSRELERRIKKLGGGGPQVLEKVAGPALGKAKALAQGPLHAVRGTGSAERMLKNAKTEYFNEHEEIATYTAIEALAESVGDSDTAKLARAIRRDEERMAKYLATQIPVLTKAVVNEEIPAAERRDQGRSRRTTRTRKASSTSSRSRASGSRSRASSQKRSTGTKRRSSSQRRSTRSRARSGS
jgi:ferritin-like metal-binding protein YciE